jgi:GxxExxY protein
MKSGNHEGREVSDRKEREESARQQDRENSEQRQGREEDPFSRRAMRVASPLSVEEERLMHQTIGCAIAVHRALGPGFLETIYKKAMCIEFEKRGLAYECERTITVTYNGVAIPGQRIDLVIGNLVIVELKAVAGLEEIHRAQLISYLRTTGLRAGLLINFRVRVLKDGLRRVVLSQ